MPSEYEGQFETNSTLLKILCLGLVYATLLTKSAGDRIFENSLIL
jgi:hypothetical protein